MKPTESGNRGSKLLKNLGIYALGNISSKLIMFILVPVYSFFISPDELGRYDIFFMCVTVLLPIVSLQLRDGTFRFLVDTDDEERRKKVVTFSLKTLVRNFIVCAGAGAILSFVLDAKYLWYVIGFAASLSLYEVIVQAVRGLGHTKAFAGAGILTSFLICGITLPLVAVFEIGIDGIFIGNIAARLIVIALIELRLHLFSRYFVPQLHDRALGREILGFSVPLVVVTLLLWGLSSSNRFFIQHFVGYSENGLFSVAQKFAAILETLALIFYQAWQETAIKQYDDSDRNAFYSRILNIYIWFLTLLVVVVSYGVNLLYGWIVSAEYQESRFYLYPLLSSSMLVSLCFFYDVGYQCVKKTVRELPGLVIALAISLAGNFFFVQSWGVYGILATLNLSYLVLIAIRIADTKKYIRLTLTWRSFLSMAVLVAAGVFYYILPGKLENFAFGVLMSAVLLACVPPEIIKMVLSKIKPS